MIDPMQGQKAHKCRCDVRFSGCGCGLADVAGNSLLREKILADRSYTVALSARLGCGVGTWEKLGRPILRAVSAYIIIIMVIIIIVTFYSPWGPHRP
jgi:hypothetical protein